MGIYVLAIIYIWILLGFIFEIVKFISDRRFREAINNQPIAVTLVCLSLGFGIFLYSFIYATRMMVIKHRKEKQEKKDRENNIT